MGKFFEKKKKLAVTRSKKAKRRHTNGLRLQNEYVTAVSNRRHRRIQQPAVLDFGVEERFVQTVELVTDDLGQVLDPVGPGGHHRLVVEPAHRVQYVVAEKKGNQINRLCLRERMQETYLPTMSTGALSGTRLDP